MICVLVTGTTGQVVTSLAEAGPVAGFDVVIAGRPAFDLTSPDVIGEILRRHRPDVVVNAAAYTAVDRAESEPELAFAVNATGAEAMARAAQEAGVPIIHISTDYVFDGAKTSPYVETDPVGPASVYGSSKLEGERLVAAAAPRHIILRTAWVHSPFGANFVKTMLRLAATRPELGVVDDQVGSPTYAPHLAHAILAVARRIAGAPVSSPYWGCYHAGGSGTTSWCGLAREVFAVSRRVGGPVATVKPITTADYPTPATRPANSRLDSTKLGATFGVSLPDWRVGVEDCVTRIIAGAQTLTAPQSSKDLSA